MSLLYKRATISPLRLNHYHLDTTELHAQAHSHSSSRALIVTTLVLSSNTTKKGVWCYAQAACICLNIMCVCVCSSYLPSSIRSLLARLPSFHQVNLRSLSNTLLGLLGVPRWTLVQHILFHYLSFTVAYHIILFCYPPFVVVHHISFFRYMSFVVVISKSSFGLT
jgi:hypothetical protein